MQEGELPRRISAVVMEWARAHRAELQKNWTQLATEGTFNLIPPLV